MSTLKRQHPHWAIYNQDGQLIGVISDRLKLEGSLREAIASEYDADIIEVEENPSKDNYYSFEVTLDGVGDTPYRETFTLEPTWIY